MGTESLHNYNVELEKGFDILVFVALILVVAKDYFLVISGFRSEFVGIFLLIIACIYRICINKTILINFRLLLLFSLISVAWVGSIFTTYVGNFSKSSYLAAFLVAILIYTIKPRNLLKSLSTIVFINVLMQLYESVSGNLFFVYEVEGPDQYDEIGLSRDGSMRTKGMFVSPLNGVAMAMSNVFLNPRSIFKWFLLVLTSLLAQGRLGLVVGVVGLIVSSVLNKKPFV